MYIINELVVRTKVHLYLSCNLFQAMGIPFRRLICASNSNNVLTEFFNTGRYNMIGRSLHLTATPAIDILKSSNLERFLYHVTYDNAAKVKGYYDKLDQEQYFTVEKSVRPNNLVLFCFSFINKFFAFVIRIYAILRASSELTGVWKVAV